MLALGKAISARWRMAASLPGPLLSGDVRQTCSMSGGDEAQAVKALEAFEILVKSHHAKSGRFGEGRKICVRQQASRDIRGQATLQMVGAIGRLGMEADLRQRRKTAVGGESLREVQRLFAHHLGLAQ